MYIRLLLHHPRHNIKAHVIVLREKHFFIDLGSSGRATTISEALSLTPARAEAAVELKKQNKEQVNVFLYRDISNFWTLHCSACKNFTIII